MIRLSDVTITRGPNRVVEHLTVDVDAGEIFWVTGPNGGGKSSLLRVIVGLDPPRRGSVIRSGPPLLYFHSEMALPGSATIGGWERLVQQLSRADSGSERTPLWPDASGRRRVGQLSTGQRKRLLLDALLRQEGPLALDEPFEHLSPGAKEDLAELLEQRAARSVVLVATNQHGAGSAGTGRGLWLEGGVATGLGLSGPRLDAGPGGRLGVWA